MIQIRELRIGNIIETGGEVKEVDIETLMAIDKNPENFTGIKVTEEWLDKFNIPITENREMEYWFDFKGSWLVEVIQEDSTENNYIAQCFFVHQLQNIYFALTGEELNDPE